MPVNTKFNKVSTFKAQIAHVYSGVHQYLPILFDDQHFCVMSTNIHAILMGILSLKL